MEIIHSAQERYGSVIFALWHNRFFYMPFAYPHIREGQKIAVMVSRSKDGEYLDAIMRGAAIKIVRGSTSKGGKEAARKFARLVKSGDDGAITPDGPRGPLYRVKPGVVVLSQLTGKPIIPATILTKWHVRLKSWDGFYIPIPFSKGLLVVAEPVMVGRESDEEQRCQKDAELEEKLLALNQEVEELVYGRSTQCTLKKE